jgi:biotin-(acetyl-CoA carboxylase) ligase
MTILDELEMKITEAEQAVIEAKEAVKVLEGAGINVTNQKARIREAENRLTALRRSYAKVRGG